MKLTFALLALLILLAVSLRGQLIFEPAQSTTFTMGGITYSRFEEGPGICYVATSQQFPQALPTMSCFANPKGRRDTAR